MVSEKNKINIRTVAVITLCWIIFVILVLSYEIFTFKIRDPEFYESQEFGVEFISNFIAGALAGIIGGSLLVFGLRSRTRKQPFYTGLLMTGLYFVLIYLFVALITSFVFISIEEGLPFYHSQVINNTLGNMTEAFQVRNILLWTFIVVATQFVLQVNDKFGPGNLWKMITGKYYHPKEELRIFMFLDIKSSTSIAEKLGHQRYYHFLNDFYAEISDPILNHKAEIYQYVGDEIVVSWTTKNAIHNKNCLICFFSIKKELKKKKDYFEEQYGIEPEFKAGIHFGPVTVGEVGIIKRDFVFTGDVLNTTARIQSLCNKMNVDILVSDNTLALFDQIHPFTATFIEKMELRGKEKRINLNTIELADS